MLVDRVTKKNYSTHNDAIRELGKKEFYSKVKRNEIEYIQCRIVD